MKRQSKSEPSTSNKVASKNTTIKGKKQIKATLKRLMVPELPDPVKYEALGQAPLAATAATAMTLAPKASETVTPLASAVEASEAHPDTSAPNQASNLSELQTALHPKQDTSLWVLISLAVVLLVAAAVLLLLIIFR